MVKVLGREGKHLEKVAANANGSTDFTRTRSKDIIGELQSHRVRTRKKGKHESKKFSNEKKRREKKGGCSRGGQTQTTLSPSVCGALFIVFHYCFAIVRHILHLHLKMFVVAYAGFRPPDLTSCPTSVITSVLDQLVRNFIPSRSTFT